MKAVKRQQETEMFLIQLLDMWKQQLTPQDERKKNMVFPLKMIKGQRTLDDVNRRQSKTKTAVIIALNIKVNIVKNN